MRRTETLGEGEPGRIRVDGDADRRFRNARPLDGRQSDAAAAEHGNHLSSASLTGQHRGAKAGRHTAADQTRQAERQRVGHGDDAARSDDDTFGKTRDAHVATQGPVAPGERPVVRVGSNRRTDVEAPREAGPTATTARHPGQHHPISLHEVLHTRAEGLDHARRLVAEHGGKLDALSRAPHMEITGADAAGRNPHPHLALPRRAHHDLLDPRKRTRLVDHRRAYPDRLVHVTPLLPRSGASGPARSP
jgi:hypothetical protein